jgi:hypothetical protein
MCDGLNRDDDGGDDYEVQKKKYKWSVDWFAFWKFLVRITAA